MGLIARQSFKAATVTYLGAELGLINAIYIYPKMLSVGQLGEIQYIFNTASFVGPLLLLGLGTVLVKYFSNFSQNESKKQLFYGLVFGITFFNVLSFLVVVLLFQNEVLQFFTTNYGLSLATIYAAILVSAIHPFITLSIAFSSNHGRIAMPSLMQNLIKVILPVLVVFYYYDFYSFTILISLLIVYYTCLCGLHFLYIRKLDSFKPSFSLSEIRKDLPVKEIFSFAMFSLLASFGAILMNQIDIQMITLLLGTYDTGLYSWSFFIANSLAIPLGLLASISVPLISKFWKANDIEELNKIYGQSSRSLIVISVGLFTCIVVGLDDLFGIMPKGNEFILAKWTVIMLCLAKIIDMAAGLNSQILAMSKSYRYLLLFLGASAISNVGLNALLIPNYGIEGSAVATVFSIFIYNMLKYSFLSRKFNLRPVVFKSLVVVPIATVLYVIAGFIPHFSSGFLNIIVFSGSVFVIYYLTAYRLKLAPELNDFVNKQLRRLNLKPFD